MLKIAGFSYPCLIGITRSLCSRWIFAARFAIRKLESLSYIFVAGCMYSYLCKGSKRRVFSAEKCIFAVQGHSRLPKVDHFGTNRKRTYDFILVVNINYGPILHRFRDTATYWLKIAYFSHPSLIRRPHSLGSLWNFALRLSMRKLGSWGYPPVKIP